MESVNRCRALRRLSWAKPQRSGQCESRYACGLSFRGSRPFGFIVVLLGDRIEQWRRIVEIELRIGDDTAGCAGKRDVDASLGAVVQDHVDRTGRCDQLRPPPAGPWKFAVDLGVNDAAHHRRNLLSRLSHFCWSATLHGDCGERRWHLATIERRAALSQGWITVTDTGQIAFDSSYRLAVDAARMTSFWTRQLFMSATITSFSEGQAMPWGQLNCPT
jgi:hypothetical protein